MKKQTLKALPENAKKLKELASFQIPMRVTEKIMIQAYAYQYDIYSICPRCKIGLERDFQSFCDRCGQNL